MIKSKIDARERAMELAISYYHGIEGSRSISVQEMAKTIENYLVGDADLPEVEPNPTDAALKAVERLLKLSGDDSIMSGIADSSKVKC